MIWLILSFFESIRGSLIFGAYIKRYRPLRVLLKHSSMGRAYEILHLSLHLGFIRYDRLTEAFAWLWIKEVKQAEIMRWTGYLRRPNVSASFLLIWFVSCRNLHVSSLFIGLSPFTDLLPNLLSPHINRSPLVLTFSISIFFYDG